MKYARVVWRQYLADGTDLKMFPTLEDQDALTRPTNPIENVKTTDAKVPVGACKLKSCGTR